MAIDALKAESLHFADRVSEALETITEAEAWVERSEERWWCAELHRLRGVLLAATRVDETPIEAALCEALEFGHLGRILARSPRFFETSSQSIRPA